MAITKIFDIASRSLTVQRRALEITSHNIVNASNPNYSRQRIFFETDISDLSAGRVWGNGVKIQDVLRVRDSLIESHIRSANTKFSDANRQGQLINNVEKVFGEPTEFGLANLFTGFFNSFSELAVSPDSTALRNNVLNAANGISTKVNSINQSLQNQKTAIRSEFDQQVETINTLLKQIHQVNADQYANSYKGLSTNDLLDKRDYLIGELSKLVNISVVIDSTNSANISIGGSLGVDRSHSVEFESVDVNGKLSLKVKNGTMPAMLSGGELNALSEIYSTKIPDYQKKLDNLVKVFADAVNKEHSAGYTIEDPPLTGISFFEGYSNGKLLVNKDILNNINLIAVSGDGTSGNGDVAVRIAELSEAKLFGNFTLLSSYSTLINELGNNGLHQQSVANGNYMVLAQLEQQRNSLSGVSLDEEMANVLKFQRSYEASAKLISVADEMLRTIMEMV